MLVSPVGIGVGSARPYATKSDGRHCDGVESPRWPPRPVPPRRRGHTEGDMDRRIFLGTLAGGLLTVPRPGRVQTLSVSLSQSAWGQEAQKPRVVMLAVTTESDSLAAPLVGAFRQTLHDAGYLEGKNIQVDIQYLAGRLERYPEVLTDTIQRGVDVL